MRQMQSDRRLHEVAWPIRQRVPIMPITNTDRCVPSDKCDHMKKPGHQSFRTLSEALKNLVPHFRSITGFLKPNAQPADDLLIRFIDLMNENEPTHSRIHAEDLEARFFDFLDAHNRNALHAIYLKTDGQVKLIGHMTLHELRAFLRVTPDKYSPNN